MTNLGAKSKDKSVTKAMGKPELFHSTEASNRKTTGNDDLGVIKTDADALIVSGNNVGAEQKEAD